MDAGQTAPVAPARLIASADTIDVWLAFYDEIADETLLDAYRHLLSPCELEQEPRFYFAHDRKRYRVTRALVRTVLSRYAGLAPRDWRFAVNAYGRPEIANAGAELDGLSFNLSHTRGLIAMGVSRHRVLGVDVEHLNTREVSTGIADRFFAPSEVAELATVPPAQRQDRFFEYWTFKEAYIKARGMGLSIPLEQFSFQYRHAHAVDLSIEPALGDDASRWNFWQYRPTPDYLLAICAERGDGAPPRLRLRKSVPMRDEQALSLRLLKRSPALDA